MAQHINPIDDIVNEIVDTAQAVCKGDSTEEMFRALIESKINGVYLMARGPATGVEDERILLNEDAVNHGYFTMPRRSASLSVDFGQNDDIIGETTVCGVKVVN